MQRSIASTEGRLVRSRRYDADRDGRIAGWDAAPVTMPVAADRTTTPGVIDLYRAIDVAAADTARRYRIPILVELVLLIAYFGLRTANADAVALTRWLVVTGGVALISPVSGLVVLVAIAPFNEGLAITRDLGSKSALAVVLLAAVAVRIPFGGAWRRRPSVPVVLAGALMVASALSLVQTWRRWGSDFGQQAAQFWLQGIGTMLIVFVVSVWVARRGELRPLIVALAATTIAGLISLVDFGGDAAIRDGPLGWAVAGVFTPDRLTGVIRSPTSTAALVMLPATVFAAAAVLGRDWRLRIATAVLAVPLLVAAYLTYNRAVFLALFALAVVIGWRIRRGLGIAILAVGLASSVVLVPWYLSVRGSAIGGSSQLQPGQVLIATDQLRLTAWETAIRMFLDQPLLGQGYRAYRQLSVAFGDPVLNAPHNEWLRFFAEGGIVTGVLGLAFAVTTAIVLLRRTGWLETGIFGAFVSLCLAAAFNNPFLFNQVTIPAMVLAGTGVALASRSAVEPTTSA